MSTDCWTSLQQVNYLCLTAHFINSDWKLKKKVLNFFEIISHRRDGICKILDNCLHEWEIEKVFTVNIDNASSNDIAIAYLRRKWTNFGFEYLLVNLVI